MRKEQKWWTNEQEMTVHHSFFFPYAFTFYPLPLSMPAVSRNLPWPPLSIPSPNTLSLTVANPMSDSLQLLLSVGVENDRCHENSKERVIPSGRGREELGGRRNRARQWIPKLKKKGKFNEQKQLSILF